MRVHNSTTADVITGGSFGLTVVGDVLRGNTRLLQDVPFSDWSFSGDYDANVKTTGQVTVAYQDDFARSYSPRQVTDALAPFGSIVRAYVLVSLGAYVDRIPLGTFRIVEVPTSIEERLTLGGRTLTVGSVVQLTLMDLFSDVDVPFMRLENPASLTSAWAELTRIARLPVTRTVDDVAIPASVVYARNRLDAVQQIARVLGGRAYMRSDATIGVIPDDVGEPDLQVTFGESGQIIDVGSSMSSAGVFNAVFGDFEDDNGAPIHAEAKLTSGPLAVDGPFGERPVEYPGDQREFVRTQAAADTAVRNYLQLVSRQSPLEVPVKVTPDPRIEFDTVTVVRPNAEDTFTGRVVRWTLAKDQAMSLTVRVPNA